MYRSINKHTYLYILHTSVLPDLGECTAANLADDTVADSNQEAVRKIQDAQHSIKDWTRIWKIKLIGSKCIQVTFTNRRLDYITVTTNHGIERRTDANEERFGITLPYHQQFSSLGWRACTAYEEEETPLSRSTIRFNGIDRY